MREETGKDQYEVVVKLKAIWLELSVLVCVAWGRKKERWAHRRRRRDLVLVAKSSRTRIRDKFRGERWGGSLLIYLAFCATTSVGNARRRRRSNTIARGKKTNAFHMTQWEGRRRKEGKTGRGKFRRENNCQSPSGDQAKGIREGKTTKLERGGSYELMRTKSFPHSRLYALLNTTFIY